MIGIYKITNPNGRVYIGQSVNIEKRLLEYKKIRCPYQYRLLSSLKKYGPENHIFEIIEECDIDNLNARERFWQDHYEVLSEKGLNCILTSCNSKSGEISEETKFKISNSMKGKLHSLETKMKMSESRRGVNNHNFGKSLSPEHKLKISQSLLGRKSPKSKKRINNKDIFYNTTIILDENTGIYYYGFYELASIYNINNCTLRDHINGRTKINKFSNFKKI